MPKEVTFEQLKKRKLAVSPVDVSEFFEPGSVMYVRELSAAEAMKAAKSGEGNDDENDLEWFSMCLCDKAGKSIAPDGESIDRDVIPAGLFRIIVEAAVELNGFGEDDAKKN